MVIQIHFLLKTVCRVLHYVHSVGGCESKIAR